MTINWFLYILECRDDSFYTGVTRNITERIKKHNSGKGAKYTRSRRPCHLIYFEKFRSESKVRRREREIKSWTRKKKEILVSGFPSSNLNSILMAPRNSRN